MPDPKRGRVYLTMAQKDLRAIERMKDDEEFAEEIFGLHAQQAVEKVLKAWLCLTEAAVPRIHDIEELMALLVEYGETVPEPASALVELTDFAVQFRYELYSDFSEPLDRPGITRRVRMLVDIVRRRFGNHAGDNESGG